MKCPHCGKVTFFDREKCPRCGYEMKRRDQLLSHESVLPADEKAHSWTSSEAYPSSTFIEEIVGKLREDPPKAPYCFIALFGDRPLSGKLGGGESIMIYTSADRARRFINGYQQYYHTTKPLSVLALGSVHDLWAMLHNPSNDPRFKGPLGLIINFDYSGTPHQAYGCDQLEAIGLEGLRKGMEMIR
jgi:uncharacterized C2H2 Zn-finger protein